MNKQAALGVCEAYGYERCIGRCRDLRDCTATPLPVFAVVNISFGSLVGVGPKQVPRCRST